MNAEQALIEAAKARWKAEIEKAIDQVRLGMIPKKPRTKLDQWWRRRFYIETAQLRKCAERGQGSVKKKRPRAAFSWRRKQSKSEVGSNENM